MAIGPLVAILLVIMKRIARLSLTALTMLTACGGTDADPAADPLTDSMEQALLAENGGFEMADEAPQFGLPEIYGTEAEWEPVKVVVGWENATLSGSLTINQGTAQIIGVIGFEGADDELDQPDASTVTFATHTRPHVDGVIIGILAPITDEPLVLTLTTDTGKQLIWSVDDVLNDPAVRKRADGSRLGVMARIVEPGE